MPAFFSIFSIGFPDYSHSWIYERCWILVGAMLTIIQCPAFLKLSFPAAFTTASFHLKCFPPKTSFF